MRRHVKLFAPRKDGSCIADHIKAKLDQDEEATWPEDTPLPELPEELQEIWDWYWSIREAVPNGANGAEPMSHLEIKAWAEMTNVTITPFILRLLRILDRAYLAGRLEQIKSSKPPAARSKKR